MQLFEASPTFGGLENDHRPARRRGGCSLLQIADCLIALLQGCLHGLVDIVPSDNVRLVAVTTKETC